jgi:hypothetical protein
MKKRLFIIPLLIIIGALLLCVISAALADHTWWLYQHNRYFEGFSDFLHGRR